MQLSYALYVYGSSILSWCYSKITDISTVLESPNNNFSYSVTHKAQRVERTKETEKYKSPNDSARAIADCCSKRAQSHSPDSPLHDLSDLLPTVFLFVLHTGNVGHWHRNHQGLLAVPLSKYRQIIDTDDTSCC